MKWGWLSFLVVMLLAIFQCQAQSLPQYELTIQHPVLAGTTYRFDIYVRCVGDTSWRIGTSQFILTFNAGAFSSPVLSRVAASEQIGSGYSFGQVISGNELHITLGGNGSYASALDIDTGSPGTRVSTYEISGVSVTVLSAGLTWVNLPSPLYTSVSQIDGSDAYGDITNPASHLNGGGEFGRYSGYTFDDLNGDGVWEEPGEPAINGWVIGLTKDTLNLSATSGSGAWPAGYYEFINVTPDTYSVGEVAQGGWTATTSPATPVVLLAGQNSQNNNFGNFYGATISGSKFNDFDRDSIKDLSETAIGGWLIYLSRAGVHVDSQYTDVGGNYQFGGLPTGTYEVSEEARTGWSQTVPSAPGVYSVVVDTSPFSATGKIFGNFHISPTGGTGSISGMKFEDMNGNGVHDGGDVGVQYWKLYLSIGFVHVDSTLTNAAGQYSFSLLDDGTYSVSEASPSDWIRSYPAGPGSYELTIGDLQRTDTGITFGNYRLGRLSGVVYQDLDHNGAKGLPEPGLTGFTLGITGPDGPVQIQSQAGGAWSLAALRPGQYTVTQQPQPPYELTQPAAGSYNITLTSGAQVGNLNFGNSTARDTFDYRTFSYESLARARDERGKLGYAMRRKADKVEFCEIYINTAAVPADELDLLFHTPLYIGDSSYPLLAAPTPLTIDALNGGLKIALHFSPPIPPGDTVEVCGWAKKGRLLQHANVSWLSQGQRITRADLHGSHLFYLNALRLPMPNPLNAAQESFTLGGFVSNGFLAGIPRLDKPRSYAWVRMLRFADLQKSLSQRELLHSATGHGFDFTINGRLFFREQRKLSPLKHNNRLFGDLMALRVNIVASELGITPVGLGQLIYDDGIAPLSGLMVEEIGNLADTALTYWGGRTPAEYIRLDTVIRRINMAFEGPMDTVSFMSTLRYIGYGKLRDIPYLRANPNVAPKTLEPVRGLQPEVPDAYALLQNYPNPFNPVTTIEFELPEPGLVSLRIYDILGEEVATIVHNEAFDEGYYEYDFDASSLPSGVYFYRLQAGSFERIMKMLLVR